MRINRARDMQKAAWEAYAVYEAIAALAAKVEADGWHPGSLQRLRVMIEHAKSPMWLVTAQANCLLSSALVPPQRKTVASRRRSRGKSKAVR